MIDVSRNGVLSKTEFFRFVDMLSKMGYDTIELYSEDIYEVEGETYFGYMRGGYSIAELQEFDSYCRKKGVELIPCLQTLAHFTNPSKEKEFMPLLDLDDILNVDDPKVYEFLDRLIGSARKAFSSKHLNIGMDEAYRLGLGKHLQEHGYEAQSGLMLRHLRKVSEIASKYGFDCHMWG
ncbi:MAG TPA: beta-N-acetylhexosaminidase, partial [Firmicutes bacterium]|nr:beta-N-acetylhexosaminidase [Bacillota bacterium]